MDKLVKIVCLGSWCKVYGEPAKVVSYIMDYKLFEDPRTALPTVGFPLYVLDKVEASLASRKINYKISYGKLHDYGVDNNFDKYYHDDMPYSYIIEEMEHKKRPIGTFIVKYEDEEPETLTIGKDIDKDAELVNKVISNEVGSTFNINEFKIELVDKNIDFV